MSTSTNSQTYWKRIKVPPELLAGGWELVKRDTTSPFAMVNTKLGQDTGGFPDPQEAISAAQELAVELEEAAAIASEGALTNGERPTVLPLNLVDEGWKLHYQPGKPPRDIYAARGMDRELRTDSFADPADAVAAAVKLETERQADIERNERGEGDVVITRSEVEEFVARGAAAQSAVDQTINHHQEQTPAALVLELERIRTDGGTQQRSLFDLAVVEDYREIMAADLATNGADHFPPVEVFFDGVDYWLADGFYRLEARRKLGQASGFVLVRQGTQRDAVLYSLGANAEHGLRRTPADKRLAVLKMIRDPEWATWSDAVIAERVRVSVPLVRKLRHQEEELAATNTDAGANDQPAGPKASKRRGRDGRMQDTTRIGKRVQKATAQAVLALEAAEAGAPKKTKNAPNAASARIEHCADCNKEITAGDFQNELGQCWDCAPRIGGKKTPGKRAIAGSDPELGLPPTFAELGQGRDLKLSIYCLRSQPGRAFVSVLVDKGTSDLHEFAAAEVILGTALVSLIEAQLKRLPTKKAAVKTATRKPARRAVKAPAPPARKTATKATVKTTGKKITKAITKKAAVERVKSLPKKLASKAPRRPTKRAPGWFPPPAKRPAARKPRKARSR